MKTTLSQIVDLSRIGQREGKKLNEVLQLAASEQLDPSSANEQKVLLLLIDFQRDFMEQGELGVPGSHKDVEQVIRLIYEKMENITRISFSLDTHQPYQIFHPVWWINREGKYPEPYTIITAEDVAKGRWLASNPLDQKKSEQYVRELERASKKALCIWPYHCLEGTDGHALESQLSNLLQFYSVARHSPLTCLVKGKDPYSEMYGIIRPEVDRGAYSSGLLDMLPDFDKIWVAGEAKSHCVLESVRQICEHYPDRPEVTQKMIILEDCMSCIPGFEEETERLFDHMQKDYGFQRSSAQELMNKRLQ
ncbi:hypothetical protein ABNB59_05950 [Paenibacillus larvae]|uniref:Nicotinamidase n=1 Tax=Paenibacillus larvae TaxID=1464 RepID=A0AAP5N0V7_9BACL|nr:hypothetical protein [Paenibacillus larvae]AQR77526.1 hypothetical protein BXP28_09405 [Paenibacillus larvae subsp. larvae]AVF21420.1 hypothetical protein ERICI_01536 [Paenibacillus larvae subsp. larvae]ETK30210.1 hypothetical protein ERIC1_1c37750 [Paenibacillus larvae subsp. larvae DSM 25719]MCY7489629.1 hypothetical protein [Paenibacillus larvae]MCY9562460.1 hypothetical protein [Paenibacillus larvae]